jgi:sigma-E factor negative regulatory protein RseC
VLTRTGRIAARRGDELEIEFAGQPSGCAGCQSGCGLMQLAAAFRRPRELLHLTSVDAGDWVEGRRVRVSIPMQGLPRALLIAYALPLLSLLLAAGLAQRIWPGGDGAALFACGAGLSAGVLAARLLGRRAMPSPRIAAAPDD